MTAARKSLADALKPILPRGWAIVDSSRSVDDVEKTVVQVQMLRMSRLPAAPIGKHLIGMLITISAPEQSVQRAEDRLDEHIDDLVHALDELGIRWTGAEKVADPASKRLLYQIPVDVISTKGK